MVLFLVKHKTNKIFRLCFLMAQTHFLEQYRDQSRMELADYFGEDHPGISAITTHLC
jgi:hypothetical protein